MVGTRWLTERIHLVGAGTGVTRLELFLDLVFVYAFLNVTGLTAADQSVVGLTRGLLLIALLWWCWVPYVWLGSVLRLDRGVTLLLIFVLIATMFLVGVSLQEVPAGRPNGLLGRLVFVVGYVVVRLGPLLILLARRWRDRPLRRHSMGSLPFTLAAMLPLLASALLPEFLLPGLLVDWTRFGLVLLAIAIDYTGVYVARHGSWKIPSAAYWTERHALILLVAIGETIISIGVSQGLAVVIEITWSLIGGIVLGVLTVGVLWALYFDIARYAGEQAIERATGQERTVLGIQAYTFLHLPMIVGLILVSFGLKVGLSDLGHGSPRLGLGPVVVLYGGVAVYLLGLIGFERRVDHRWGRSPVLGVALVTFLIPVAAQVPVLVAMLLLAGAVIMLVLADHTVFRGRHRELHRLVRPVKQEAVGVTPKELFFDLVFVYAFLQVTGLMVSDPSWRGLLRGMVVLTLLWWAWSCYAWLANSVRSESGLVRMVLLVVMVNTLVIAFVIPQAFFGADGGLPGPVLFVWCYAVIRILHLVATWLVARGDLELRRQVYRMAVPTGISLALLTAAATVWLRSATPDEPNPVRVGLWIAAVLVDLGGVYLLGRRGWRIRSAAHWADRHALIILIALGEVIISMGLAVADRALSLVLLVGLLLGVALLATLWWAYFWVDASTAERSVAAATGDQRVGLARDGYSYLHLPMVAGAVLISFGLREALSEVGQPDVDADLVRLAHLTLYGGVIVFLLAVEGFWLRTGGSVRRTRLVWTIVLVALTPATAGLSPVAGLAVLTATGLVFVGTEASLARLHPPE